MLFGDWIVSASCACQRVRMRFVPAQVDTESTSSTPLPRRPATSGPKGDETVAVSPEASAAVESSCGKWEAESVSQVQAQQRLRYSYLASRRRVKVVDTAAAGNVHHGARGAANGPVDRAHGRAAGKRAAAEPLVAAARVVARRAARAGDAVHVDRALFAADGEEIAPGRRAVRTGHGHGRRVDHGSQRAAAVAVRLDDLEVRRVHCAKRGRGRGNSAASAAQRVTTRTNATYEREWCRRPGRRQGRHPRGGRQSSAPGRQGP